MGAAMSALGKVGMAANPANQFKNQSEIFNKRIAQPLNQLGQNQVMKQYGINQQQWNDLQKKSILDRAKFGIGNTVNLSLIHISEPTRPCGTSRMPSSA